MINTLDAFKSLTAAGFTEDQANVLVYLILDAQKADLNAHLPLDTDIEIQKLVAIGVPINQARAFVQIVLKALIENIRSERGGMLSSVFGKKP